MKMTTSWKTENNKLVKEFVFHDFREAWSFMCRVAELAEKHNHHPDWSNSYNRVSIQLTTHDKGGITEKDYELAKAIDNILY